MELFGIEFDSWMIATILAVLMIACWALGWQRL
jgi:preprotein translocase subunit SecF